MKKLIIFLITIYQKILSYTLKNLLGIKAFCRYSPTCSEYAKQSIAKYGIIKGGWMAILRILSCQPVNLFNFKLKT